MRVRVVSYNVHACIGMDGRFEPHRIADVLQALQADFIALQEVEERRHAGKIVSDYLANRLDMTVAGRSSHKRFGIDFGNLLLASNTPLRSDTHDIAYAGREPRAIVEARFAADSFGNELRLLTTHFGLSARERRSQLTRLLSRLEDADEHPVILCADFNEWRPYSRLHRKLGRVLGHPPVIRTFPSRFPAFSLDRIYASGTASIARISTLSNRVARIASDHLPVIADIDIRTNPLEEA